MTNHNSSQIRSSFISPCRQIGAIAGLLALILVSGCAMPAPTQSQPIGPLPTEPVEFDE